MLGMVVLAAVVVVVVLVFVGSMGADKTGVQADSAPARSSTSSGSPRPQATLPSDDGVVALPDGKWLLTPGWTFPLSIHGADRPRRPPKIPHLWPPQTPPPELT